MHILIVVGMPASGKNTARTYAESRGFPYFATGDMVRSEVLRRGLDGGAETVARVSDELRGEDGMGVTRRALAAARASGHDVVFMEGMRSWPEIELVREKVPAVVIAFVAPRAFRRERVAARGRSDDSEHAFDVRDMREIVYGTAVPIALADEYILNVGTLDETYRALDATIRKYAP